MANSLGDEPSIVLTKLITGDEGWAHPHGRNPA